MRRTRKTAGRWPLTFTMMGGLGNQLFQFATALSLRAKSGRPLLLDTSWYRIFGLQEFCLDACFDLEGLEIETVTHPNRSPQSLQRLLWSAKLRTPSGRKVVHLGPQFDPRVLDLTRTEVLTGYFQSWRYFESDIAWIVPLFSQSLNSRLLPDNTSLNTPGKNQVALHLRLGDYNSPSNRRRYGDMSLGYIMKSANLLRLMDPEVDTIVVFSNDIREAQTLLSRLDLRGYQMSFQTPSEPGVDLLQMSKFSSLIMANSSFSWWAAALPSYGATKNIFAPSPWMLDPLDEGGDLFLPNWITVSR